LFHLCCLCGIRVCSCMPTSTGKIGLAILNSLCAYAKHCCRIFTFRKCACSKISVFSSSVCIFLRIYVHINAASVYKHYAHHMAGENDFNVVMQLCNWPSRWNFFPPQNYNSQSIGSALRASPFAPFGAFARKHNPNVGSALRASPLERRKCTWRHFFAPSTSASRCRTCCARLRPRRVCFIGQQLGLTRVPDHSSTTRVENYYSNFFITRVLVTFYFRLQISIPGCFFYSQSMNCLNLWKLGDSRFHLSLASLEKNTLNIDYIKRSSNISYSIIALNKISHYK